MLLNKKKVSILEVFTSFISLLWTALGPLKKNQVVLLACYSTSKNIPEDSPPRSCTLRLQITYGLNPAPSQIEVSALLLPNICMTALNPTRSGSFLGGGPPFRDWVGTMGPVLGTAGPVFFPPSGFYGGCSSGGITKILGSMHPACHILYRLKKKKDLTNTIFHMKGDP